MIAYRRVEPVVGPLPASFGVKRSEHVCTMLRRMRDITYPVVIGASRTAFKALGIKFQSSGAQHIPRHTGAVLASNHIGYVDYIFNGLAARPSKRFVRFMAKKEAFAHPAAGAFMRSFKHIEVDRASGEKSMRDAVDAVRSGEIVGIYPEATISRSFEVKEFKTGAVRIAAEAKAPLIPMVVWGTQLIMTKDHPKDLTGRGKTIALHVGEPLYPTGEDPVAETEELRQAVIDLHTKALDEYPVDMVGQWWAPASRGGLAPTPEEAARLDEKEKAAKAAKRAAREAKDS